MVKSKLVSTIAIVMLLHVILLLNSIVLNELPSFAATIKILHPSAQKNAMKKK